MQVRATKRQMYPPRLIKLPWVTKDPLYIGARVYKNRLREWWPGEIDQVRLSHAVLHDADFVPQVRFPSTGPAMFLSWSRPYLGPEQEVAYEVLRSLDGEEFVSLLAEPMTDTCLLDAPPQPGRMTYRVRLAQRPGPGPADQWVEWLPATAPPTPAIADSAIATRR